MVTADAPGWSYKYAGRALLPLLSVENLTKLEARMDGDIRVSISVSSVIIYYLSQYHMMLKILKYLCFKSPSRNVTTIRTTDPGLEILS